MQNRNAVNLPSWRMQRTEQQPFRMGQRSFFGRAVCHSQKEGSAGFSWLEADQIGFCTVQPSDASAAAVNEQLSEGIAAGEQAVEKAVGKTL